MVALPEAGNSRTHEEADKLKIYFGGSINRTSDDLDVEV